jgi:uncharacterized protein (DUF1778 family)
MVSIITVRLTGDLHQRIKDAAWRSRTSQNKFILRAVERALEQAEHGDPDQIPARLEEVE